MAAANHSKQISKPWLSWAFWIVCFFGINILLAVVQEKLNITFFKGQLLLQGGCEIGIIIATLLINHFYTKEKFHFSNWNIFLRSWMVDLFIGYYIIAIILNHNQMHHIGFYFVLAALIGIAEEFTFRGMILGSLIHNWRGKNPILGGVLLSSLIFGLTHAVNAFSQPLPNTIVQIVVAFSLGVILAFMYLRTNNLITPILFHLLVDFTSISLTNTTESQAGWGAALPILIVALLVLFFQLKPRPRTQIKRDFNL